MSVSFLNDISFPFEWSGMGWDDDDGAVLLQLSLLK